MTLIFAPCFFAKNRVPDLLKVQDPKKISGWPEKFDIRVQIDWANEYVNLQVVSKEQKCNWMPIFEYKLLRFQLHFEFDSVWHYRFEKGPIESSLQSKIFGFFLLSFPQNERKIYLVCLS